MLLSIDLTNEKPIYEQLHDQLLCGIAMGEFAPGDALPSIRQLASDLNINMHTANKAYATLESEGFVVSHKRDGFVVKAWDAMKISPQHLSSMQEKLRTIASEAVCRSMTQQDFLDLCQRTYVSLKDGGSTNGKS